MSMDIYEKDSEKAYDYLIKSNRFNYYNLSICLERKDSYLNAIKFIEEANRINKDLNLKNNKMFRQVKIYLNTVVVNL